MDPFYVAISLFRRRKYDLCIDKCNELLLKNPAHQGPWELKMRAMTQRVYIDDIDIDDGMPDEVVDSRTGTARPNTSLKTGQVSDADQRFVDGRPRTSTGRPMTGVTRPGTMSQRPGTSTPGNRTALRTAGRPNTGKNVRLGSASMFAYGDPTGPLFHASRLNPEKYAKKESISKPLFQYLYYHDGNLDMALLLCNAVIRTNGNATAWWWHTQKARCCIAMGKPREAEVALKASLAQLQHPDSVLLLARVYIKLEQPLEALEVCQNGLDKLPGEVSLLTQQARIHELVGSVLASVRIYKQIGQMEAMNVEALACIAVHHFYNNNPETALLYYRRILSMGAHSAEIYCNIGLCCLYGGQLDLVLPCFQRALRLATTKEQKSDVWYNLSFVAITNGDLPLAKRCLRICISADGAYGAALNNLAVLCYRTGQQAKSKAYFTAAKTVLPNCHEVNKNLEIMDRH